MVRDYERICQESDLLLLDSVEILLLNLPGRRCWHDPVVWGDLEYLPVRVRSPESVESLQGPLQQNLKLKLLENKKLKKVRFFIIFN